MLNFLILITKVHQGSSCSCCVGIVQSSDIKLHTAARWSVRHPVRCRRNGLDWPFSHCLLKHIKNSKINRHHSYCRVLLLSVFSASILCPNKCKRRRSGPVKDAEQAWLRLKLREKSDVLQPECLGGVQTTLEEEDWTAGDDLPGWGGRSQKHPKDSVCSSVLRKQA